MQELSTVNSFFADQLLSSSPFIDQPLGPSVVQTFTVSGLDQFGRDMEIGGIKWSATGGQMGNDGVFTAGTDEGNFVVTGETQGKTATARVTISKESKPGRGPEPEPHTATRLEWSAK